MSKEMIVSVNGREKKIAILENGKVTEFYIERGEENSGVVGNVYKGRVMRVLPGMQSAFVDIGLERDAFLYVSDFFDEEEEIERIVMEKEKGLARGSQTRGQRTDRPFAYRARKTDGGRPGDRRTDGRKRVEELRPEPEAEARKGRGDRSTCRSTAGRGTA